MKTNFQMLRDLEEFMPKRRGILDAREAETIRNTLCIPEMDEMQLRNLRDFAVMFFHDKIDSHQDNFELAINLADKMSAVCGVIDGVLWAMGCEI